MLMHFAFLNDLFVDFSFWLGTIGLLLFLRLVETCKVKVIMSLLELLVILIRAKVDVVELFEVSDLLAAVSESLGRLFF